MSIERIKETFFRLPKYIKLVGAGALILGLSTLLPWYADLDAYKIGDQFLGLTGPASFVGIVILLLSGFSLWVFSYHLLERRTPRLGGVREGILNLFVAIESLFLLVLVNSIYFHPKFGVNITLKESRFGMVIAFAGAAVLLVGAYLQNREEIAKAGDVGKLEPLIDLEKQHPRAESQRPAPDPARTQGTLEKMPARTEPRKLFPHSGARGFLFGDAAARAAALERARPAAVPPRLGGETPRPQQKPEMSEETKQEKKEPPSSKDDSGSYMIRMDL